MRPCRSRSSIITGSNDHDLGFLDYILYERISGLLSFPEFIRLHERVVDLAMQGTFTFMNKWDQEGFIHATDDEQVDITFCSGSSAGKRSIDEHALDFTGRCEVLSEVPGYAFGFKHDLLQLIEEEEVAVDGIVLLDAFFLSGDKPERFEIGKFPPHGVHVLIRSPYHLADIEFALRVEQEEGEEFHPGPGRYERFEHEYIMYSLG